MNRLIRIGRDGASVSRFCLGTIYWGSKVIGDDLDRLYDTFRQAGGNFFDTAHIYAAWLPDGNGASERTLGDIVRRRGDRANVVLATKGGHPHLNDRYARPDRFLSPDVIARDIQESLERLGDDHIDLFYLHRDDPRVPIEEIIDLLNEHVGAKRIHALGASNWTTARIAAANAYATKSRKQGFIVSQPRFTNHRQSRWNEEGP